MDERKRVSGLQNAMTSSELHTSAESGSRRPPHREVTDGLSVAKGFHWPLWSYSEDTSLPASPAHCSLTASTSLLVMNGHTASSLVAFDKSKLRINGDELIAFKMR